MFDFEKCKVCTEKRCDLAFLQKTPEELEERNNEKIYNEIKRKKMKAWYDKEIKYWNKTIKREREAINGGRWNRTDIMHSKNFDIAINQAMKMQETYYKGVEETYSL